jgi:hypothetical protein
MADVLVKFTEPVRGSDGRTYEAQACGDIAEDGLWQGWIEFTAQGGSESVRTGRETEQPNLTDLQYWAQGLTLVYLEGALARALGEPVVQPLTPVIAQPKFEGPAGHPASPRIVGARPILNPFLVYAEGPDLLRGQLNALSRDQLTNIVKWYNLPVTVDLGTSSPAMIADDIARSISDARRPQRKVEEHRATG